MRTRIPSVAAVVALVMAAEVVVAQPAPQPAQPAPQPNPPAAPPPAAPAPAQPPAAPAPPSAAQPPAAPAPPGTEPAQPPVAEPPVAEPPSVEPPVAEPPSVEPPVAEPPSVEPPVAEPPPVSEPPVEPAVPPPVGIPPTVPPEHVVLEPEEQEEGGVTPLTISGSFWSRYELREGYAEQALTDPRLHREGDAFVYRARLGIRTNPVDLGGGQAVSVRFVPQAAGTHSTQGSPPTIGDQPNLGVYEAFVRLQSTGFALDVGRFAMNYGDARVIGDLDWNEFGRAFQGGRVRLSGSSGYYTDVFATLLTEGIGQTGSIFEGDSYFFGVYSGIGPLLGPLELDVYLLGKTTAGIPGSDDGVSPATDQEGANFFTFGSRLKGKVDIYDYHAEGGIQFGQTPVVGGDALDKLAFQADAGFGISPIRNLRVGLGGLIATGDGNPTDSKDDAWDQLYPTAHKFLGLTDVFGGRTDALSGNAEIHYAPLNSLTLALQAHALATMVEQGNGDRYSGTELDAHVIHRIGKGTKLRGMYGAFLPNGDVWVDGDPIHYFELQFGYELQ